MHNHRNPQASVSKQAPSDNFNTIDTTCEPRLTSPHLRLVEITPDDAGALTTLLRRMSRIARMELLGNAHLITTSVPDACSTFEAADVTRADSSTKHWDGLAPAPVPPTFTAAKPTQPHGQRLRPTPWPALTPQSPTVEPSRLATGWVRGATITALIALLSVISILLTLGACIATRGAR